MPSVSHLLALAASLPRTRAIYAEVQYFTGELITGTKDNYEFHWPSDYRVYHWYAAIAAMAGCLFMFLRHRSRIPKADLRNVRLLGMAFGQIAAGVLLLMNGHAGLPHGLHSAIDDVALWISRGTRLAVAGHTSYRTSRTHCPVRVNRRGSPAFGRGSGQREARYCAA
jgi:hypothetical protein